MQIIQYYLDPVTGYEFRSKPDVLRFLETGDITSCKMKPKKRDVNDLMSGENISVSLHNLVEFCLSNLKVSLFGVSLYYILIFVFKYVHILYSFFFFAH